MTPSLEQHLLLLPAHAWEMGRSGRTRPAAALLPAPKGLAAGPAGGCVTESHLPCDKLNLFIKSLEADILTQPWGQSDASSALGGGWWLDTLSFFTLNLSQGAWGWPLPPHVLQRVLWDQPPCRLELHGGLRHHLW